MRVLILTKYDLLPYALGIGTIWILPWPLSGPCGLHIQSLIRWLDGQWPYCPNWRRGSVSCDPGLDQMSPFMPDFTSFTTLDISSFLERFLFSHGGTMHASRRARYDMWRAMYFIISIGCAVVEIWHDKQGRFGGFCPDGALVEIWGMYSAVGCLMNIFTHTALSGMW